MQTAMTFSLVVLQIARLQLQVYTVQREREEFNHHGIRPLLCSLPKKFCRATASCDDFFGRSLRALVVLRALAVPEGADVGGESRLLLGRAVAVLEGHAVGRGRLVVHRVAEEE